MFKKIKSFNKKYQLFLKYKYVEVNKDYSNFPPGGTLHNSEGMPIGLWDGPTQNPYSSFGSSVYKSKNLIYVYILSPLMLCLDYLMNHRFSPSFSVFWKKDFLPENKIVKQF